MTDLKDYNISNDIFKSYFQNQSEITEDVIRSIKKQILLEIQISDDNYLNIGGNPFSKQEVLDFFDFNDVVSFRGIHFIESNPLLKNYLTKGQVPKINERQDLEELIFSEKYHLFLLPYIKNASLNLFKTELKKSNFHKCRINVSLSFFKSEFDTQEVFKPVRSIIKSYIIALKARVFNDKNKSDLKKVDFYLFLNELPDEHFETLRDEIAESLVNYSYSASLDNKQRKSSNQMLKAAKNLDCHIRLAQHIENNYNATKSRAIRIGGYQTNLRYLVILTFWIVFMMVRIYKCNQQPKYHHSNPTYTIDDKKVKSF